MPQRQLFIVPPHELPRAGSPALVLLILVSLWFGFCEKHIDAIGHLGEDPPVQQGGDF